MEIDVIYTILVNNNVFNFFKCVIQVIIINVMHIILCGIGWMLIASRITVHSLIRIGIWINAASV